MRHLLLIGGAAVIAAGCGPDQKANAQIPTPAAKLPAGEVPAPTPKDWVGVWAPLSCVCDGSEMMSDAKTRDTIRLSIENGEYKLYALTDPVKMEGKKVSSAALAVDEKAGTFTLSIGAGLGEGRKVHGIYEVTTDKLKLCYAPTDKPRPTKFESPKASGVFHEEWARVKLKK
ncbi:MAG: TIGR03067 domain-containing protein [Fimbriiglobus sp.]|jgi:uncharacterized protein (TIGR03067 family)|nr:TIGR03067 domain-containing protein [Fimbriiglobus sp.]